MVDSDPVRLRKLTNEGVEVFGELSDILSAAALAGRSSVTALIPREDASVIERQAPDGFAQPSGMLVPAMQEDHGARGRRLRNPRAIGQLCAVV